MEDIALIDLLAFTRWLAGKVSLHGTKRDHITAWHIFVGLGRRRLECSHDPLSYISAAFLGVEVFLRIKSPTC
jgi:hypothetical protein